MRTTETHCHCGAAFNGSDHCPACGCEQYEATCDHREPLSVHIYGPNLADQSRGSFEVHAAGCESRPSYLPGHDREGELDAAITFRAESREHVAEYAYGDIIDEDPTTTAADLVSDFHFAPCTERLA
jgi:hypothetical protein